MLNNLKAKPVWYQVFIFLLLTTLFTGCAKMVKDYTELYGPSSPKDRILTTEELKQNAHISFANEVQPILSNRCAVCHSCNDAPCQLNFTSIEGIDRGASVEVVYNGIRLTQQNPTRLGIDANSTNQWRNKGFFPVLNERRETPAVNQINSLLYKAITLKRLNDFPTHGRLSEDYGIGMKLKEDEAFVHEQVCPTVENYADFAAENPQWGMPFALPPLSNKEFKTIETWIEQGAKAEPIKPLPQPLKQQVAKWEKFLNGSSKKQQLMSRYIYEHIYLAHLYFKDVSIETFFTLVRSKTAPGQDIEIINTVRPYNDPGVEKVYYRIKRYTRVIVDKTHMPYELTDNRMERYTELFIDAEYSVKSLPSYESELAANPFKTYADIPAKNRYQFMLDEAQYFISGFIKGPVCRGSIALGVIDDHFWVVFMDPEKSHVSQDSKFLASVTEDLKIPSELEDNASILSVWYTYEENVFKYFTKKVKYVNGHLPAGTSFGLDDLWDGGKKNENAALTIYRHNDSSTVLKGFVGEVPKTGWVLDYPLLERIHYLLVAGYDVYGVSGHQLSTRLYMDFLRIEAELEFLAFLPVKDQVKIHRQWYRESSATDDLLKDFKPLFEQRHESNISYKTDDVKKEFFAKISNHLLSAQKSKNDYFNRCSAFPKECKQNNWAKNISPTLRPLVELSTIKGERTGIFPNVTFMRIKVDGSVKNDYVLTIVRNKSYLNVTSLLFSQNNRVESEDTLDIIPGFVGSYPNFFFEVDQNEVKQFVEQYKAVDSFEKYDALIAIYGIRRTNKRFWKVSDWFNKKYQYENQELAGLFDLNRYKNR